VGACGSLAAPLRYSANLPGITFGESCCRATERRRREDRERRCCLRLREAKSFAEAMRGRTPARSAGGGRSPHETISSAVVGTSRREAEVVT
jgi:hypothetical protein